MMAKLMSDAVSCLARGGGQEEVSRAAGALTPKTEPSLSNTNVPSEQQINPSKKQLAYVFLTKQFSLKLQHLRVRW